MKEDKYRVIWKPKILNGTNVEYSSERLSLQGALNFTGWILSKDVLYTRIEKIDNKLLLKEFLF